MGVGTGYRFAADPGQTISGLGTVIRRGTFPWTPRRGYLPKNKKEKRDPEYSARCNPDAAHNVGSLPISFVVKMVNTDFFPVSNRRTRGPSALSSEKQRSSAMQKRGEQATASREGTGSVGAKEAHYNQIVDVYRHGSCR